MYACTHTWRCRHTNWPPLSICVCDTLLLVSETHVYIDGSPLSYFYSLPHTLSVPWAKLPLGMLPEQVCFHWSLQYTHTVLWCKTKSLRRAEPLIIRHIITNMFSVKSLTNTNSWYLLKLCVRHSLNEQVQQYDLFRRNLWTLCSRVCVIYCWLSLFLR